jgi:hypothetical protein
MPSARQISARRHSAHGRRIFLGDAVDLAGQLAEGDDRAGEGDRADEDAEEDLDLQDGDFGRRLVGQNRREAEKASVAPEARAASTSINAISALMPMKTAARPTKE